MKTNDKYGDLLSGSILKHVIRLATPMIIAFIFVTGYHFVDRIFVSRLGDMATAAIGMAFTVQMVIISVGVGIGSGINSFIARNLGSNNEDDARNTALHALIIALVVGAAFTIGGLLIQRPLFRLLGAEGELLELIISYLTIILLFTPINMLAMLSNSIFQGWGDTMSPMKFMMMGNLLNLGLDPLLIFGIGPFPELGIAGAAYATAIARILSLAYVFFKIFVQKQPTRLSFSGFRYSQKIVSGIFQVGLPSSASQILTSIAMGIIFYILDPYGADAKAAYTIVFTYEMVVFLPAIGISSAVSILTGHNFGGLKLDRVDRAYFTGIGASFAIMLFSTIIILISPSTFAGIFAQSESVLKIGTKALKITAVGYSFLSVYLCSVSSFQGLGLGRQYLIANITRLYILLVPFTFIGNYFYQLEGIWYGYMLVSVISAVVLFVWHRYLFKYHIRSGKVQPL